jgi:hypothetical protein
MGFADIKSITWKILASNTPTQIFWAPWRAQRRYFLNKLLITNEGAATIVKFYDDDLSNGTPPIRGDGVNSPLLEISVPANSTFVLDEKSCPKEFFISGMVGISTVSVVVVTAEFQED